MICKQSSLHTNIVNQECILYVTDLLIQQVDIVENDQLFHSKSVFSIQRSIPLVLSHTTLSDMILNDLSQSFDFYNYYFLKHLVELTLKVL